MARLHCARESILTLILHHRYWLAYSSLSWTIVESGRISSTCFQATRSSAQDDGPYVLTGAGRNTHLWDRPVGRGSSLFA